MVQVESGVPRRRIEHRNGLLRRRDLGGRLHCGAMRSRQMPQRQAGAVHAIASANP